jgi:hypothetical protein
VVRLTLRPLYPWERTSVYIEQGAGCVPARVETFGDEISLSLTGIHTLEISGRNLVTIMATVSRLLYIMANTISVYYNRTIDISEWEYWSCCFIMTSDDDDYDNN